MLVRVSLAGPVTLTAVLMSSAVLAGPEPLDTSGHTVIRSLHAEGAQIYECKAGADGTIAWAFREPIATLIENGRTVGYHAAGPRWAFDDGDMVRGKVAATLPGKTAADIAQLKLDVVARQGSGSISRAGTVLRVDTVGGALSGSCAMAGALRSVPYSATYIFLR